MVAQIFAVIRVEKNDRVFKLPGLFQIIKHPADLYVDKVAHRPVCGSNQAVIARGHLVIRKAPLDSVGADMVSALER